MTTEHIEELNDQQIIRREKMAALAEQGIDPFGKRFERTANSAQLKEKYNDKDKEELNELNENSYYRWPSHDQAWQRKSWLCPHPRP